MATQRYYNQYSPSCLMFTLPLFVARQRTHHLPFPNFILPIWSTQFTLRFHEYSGWDCRLEREQKCFVSGNSTSVFCPFYDSLRDVFDLPEGLVLLFCSFFVLPFVSLALFPASFVENFLNSLHLLSLDLFAHMLSSALLLFELLEHFLFGEALGLDLLLLALS